MNWVSKHDYFDRIPDYVYTYFEEKASPLKTKLDTGKYRVLYLDQEGNLVKNMPLEVE